MKEMENTAKKVLVVEDEVILQKLIGKKLENRGFLTVFAHTAEEALEHLQNEKDIDVIWLDHYLPGKSDGFDFFVQIKENPDWKNIPVFLVSNSASDEKVQSYLHLGVNKYFTKANYTLDNIIDDIENYFSTKDGQ